MSLGRLARALLCEAVKVGRVERLSGHFSYCSNDFTNREEEERRQPDRKRERGKYVTHFYKYNLTAFLLFSGTLASVAIALGGRSTRWNSTAVFCRECSSEDAQQKFI